MTHEFVRERDMEDTGGGEEGIDTMKYSTQTKFSKIKKLNRKKFIPCAQKQVG